MKKDISRFYRVKPKNTAPWKLSLRDKHRNVVDVEFHPTEESAENRRREVFEKEKLLGLIEYTN